MARRFLPTSLRVATSVFVVVLLVRSVDFKLVTRVLTGVDWRVFIGVLVLAGFDRAVMIGKWLPLARAQVPELSLGEASRVYLATGLAQYILPVSIGADFLRAMAIGHRRNATAAVLASVTIERLLGILASAFMCVIAVLVATRSSPALAELLPWAIAVAVTALVLLLLPFSSVRIRWADGARRLLSDSLQGRVFELWTAYRLYEGHRKTLLAMGAATLGEQLLPIAILWLLARSLGLSVSPTQFLIVTPLMLFVARLPISFGGIGLGDGAFVYLLVVLGVSLPQATALAVAARALDVLVMVVPGLFLWPSFMRLLSRNSVSRSSISPSAPEPAFTAPSA